MIKYKRSNTFPSLHFILLLNYWFFFFRCEEPAQRTTKMSGEPTGGPGCHGDRTTGLFPPVIRGGNGVLQESRKISQKHKVKTSAGKTKVGPLFSADSKLTLK